MTIEDFKPLLAWLNNHPHWAGVVTCLIVFSETLAVVGLFIPGVVIMTAIGTLVGSGVLPAWEIFAWATFGSVAGDTLSFWLGYHYHEHIRDIWPFRLFPELFKKGEVFFQQHGAKSVFIGRFIGPFRSVIPLIAGMVNMSPIKFVITSTIASTIWAPVYMLPGILVGAASQHLAPEKATKFLIVVLSILVSFWVVFWIIKRIFVWTISLINQGLNFIWRVIQTKSYLRPLKFLLKDGVSPTEHIQLTLLISLCITLSLFIILAFNVKHQGYLTQWNEPLLHFFRGLRTNGFDHIMVATTLFAELHSMVVLLVVLFVWLLSLKQWRAAWHWLGCGVLTIVSTGIVRHFVHSPRPPGLNVSPSGWSFPSGHTVLSIALFGFLSVLVTRELPVAYRKFVYIFTTIVVGLIIYSRLYLGAHWATDIVGGILIALSCVIVTELSYRREKIEPLPLKSLLFFAFLTLFAAWSWNLQHSYKQELLHYGLKDWPDQTIDIHDWWSKPSLQPLFRTNRFGTPIQTINVQWAAGSINEIKQLLMPRGWHEVPKMDLAAALNRIASDERELQLPLFSQLYQDHTPDLVMTKFIEPENKLLLLQLWDSNTGFFKPAMHLWVGTINYHQSWKAKFLLHSNHKNSSHIIPAISALEADVKNTEWKKFPYLSIKRLDSKQDADWNGYVLYIRPRVPVH